MASFATTTAGTIVAISASLPATEDATGFTALTYTEIGEVTNLGDVGITYTPVNLTTLKERRTQKFKGSYTGGDVPLEVAEYDLDAGQAILRTALGSDNSYSFKITHQNGTDDYFTGKVMSLMTGVGGPDAIKMARISISHDGNGVRVL